MSGLLHQLLNQLHAQLEAKYMDVSLTVQQLPWVLQVADDLMTQGIQSVCVRFNHDLKAIIVTNVTAEAVKNALANYEQYYCHNDTNEQIAVIEKDGEVVNGYTKLIVICTEFEVNHDH
ncbi:hypothetical protein [Vitreoscilla stercoraria]|uniref:Uncharacterized protein n=1 Tax=Vitreoscilla stercoraria TaxID=61 RepID=A0ABY4ECW4_VITST|nr:hypothetical protein [Vitreoscilla stercoraria]UOO93595.1 hypothetical protein LVJ81_06110 [Vitreoscilla stercoraria]